MLDAGHPVWFVTSAKEGELGCHMEELGVEGRITGVVNSDAVGRGKPASGIFEETLRRADVPAGEAVAVGDAVGDAVWDVQSAKGAGIRTVAVLSGGAFDEEDLKGAGAAEVYKDCAAILEAGLPG